MRTRGTTSSPAGRLRARLPEAGFPGGAGAPSATGFVLFVLLACACLLGLSPLFGGAPAVSAGVADGQRRDAEALAKAVGASAAHGLAVAATSSDPALSELSAVHPAWRGLVVLDAASRALLAAHGEPVPVDALAGADLGRPVVRASTPVGGMPLLLSTTPLPGGRVLAVSTRLRLPAAPNLTRLVTADGRILETSGAPADRATAGLLTTAATAAGSGVLTGPPSPGPGSLVPVVAHAPAGDLGVAVLTAAWLPADSAPAPWPGLAAGGALLVLGAGSTLLLRRGLVIPLRRLRLDAVAVAAGEPGVRVRPGRVAELRRVAVALERCRRLLGARADFGSAGAASVVGLGELGIDPPPAGVASAAGHGRARTAPAPTTALQLGEPGIDPPPAGVASAAGHGRARTAPAPTTALQLDQLRTNPAPADTIAAAAAAARPRRVRTAPGPTTTVQLDQLRTNPSTALHLGPLKITTATNPRPPRRGIPARALVGLVVLVLLTWSAAVLLTLGTQPADVPPALAAGQDLRLARAADGVRSALAGGLSELRTAARLLPDGDPGPVLDRLGQDPAFRSVYLTDRTGDAGPRRGRVPLREGVVPDGEGLRQHNTSGRVPVVYGFARLGDGRALVGEFDVTRLAQPLTPAGARVRVVDQGDRTIVDTHGYLAFDPLADPGLRAATAAARTGPPPARVDRDLLVSARELARRGPVTALGWVVVAEQPVAALGVRDDVVRDRARAAALLGAVLALLVGAWHELVVVRPLRRAVAAAEQVAAGNTGVVVFPQRQDEIGTVVSCVDLCRHALADRAAPTRQLAGSRS
ncbi:HAMP domain-containing protein [Amycolatopsis sp. OK19-0408]|uniref:HAMP domain-containing protein n=1 Tax=Amycolatopsis iheyensis TaxID=2945988 RepID=A0A9X2SJK5_9PSEU|nr:HAMP domain-containing protein [Amycolatopsis iheyensis]MCR6482936.1 HAMP domain-containing protein [Amycolatopsis iheyensis]